MLYPCGIPLPSGQRPTTAPVMPMSPPIPSLMDALKKVPTWVWIAAGIGVLVVAAPEIKRRRRH